MHAQKSIFRFFLLLAITLDSTRETILLADTGSAGSVIWAIGF
jgi:hypothetical protein